MIKSEKTERVVMASEFINLHDPSSPALKHRVTPCWLVCILQRLYCGMSSDIPTVKIAVVGVGSAGLAALKQAVDAFTRPEVIKRVKLDIVGFETRSEVGGLWSVHFRILW